MSVWVDTDFGFDDLWALLLLRHLDVSVEGVSLVAGNVPLSQVVKNAEASTRAFDFIWPVFAGADNPLVRTSETAEQILGKFGMQSRGLQLPYEESTSVDFLQSQCGVEALANWLLGEGRHEILALGPLTNLALLQQRYPDAATNIDQITWLGGSRGRGNHTELAEYNAVADPEALAIVAEIDCPLRMVELELCRQVCFEETDIPTMRGKNQHLIADLVGGYLDIALQRGRSAMSIYDPLAALAFVDTDMFEFVPASLRVGTQQGAKYGQTVISDIGEQGHGGFEIADQVDEMQAKQICLSALVMA